MAITKTQTATISEVDNQIRSDDELQDAFLVPGNGRYQHTTYVPWYSRMLTAIALVVREEEVMWATTDFSRESDEAKFYVFTGTRVIVSTVTGLTGDADPHATTRVVPSSGLRAIDLAASATVELSERRFDWPGDITARLEFEGIEPFEVTFPGLDKFHSDDPSKGMKLIDHLLETHLD